MSLQAEYPVTSICEVLGLARSTFYHRASEVDESDLQGVKVAKLRPGATSLSQCIIFLIHLLKLLPDIVTG
jgi:hypothetical protein